MRPRDSPAKTLPSVIHRRGKRVRRRFGRSARVEANRLPVGHDMERDPAKGAGLGLG
jgi:hypothetical protein